MICMPISLDRMKIITFSVYALFSLPPRTELRPGCFSAKPAEEIPELRE